MCLICNKSQMSDDCVESSVQSSVQLFVRSSQLNALLCTACVEILHAALCGDRVSQMTKTYNDVEAVTRLLEEKERDLELAARIGQSLLERNQEFESRSEHLEEVLNEATEKISQLQHEISMKDTLLRVYVQDYEGDLNGALSYDGLSSAGRGIEAIHERVRSLEEENLKLTVERAELETDTETLEARERHLADDCVRQLAVANHQVAALQTELATREETNNRQQQEIVSLQTRLVSLESQLARSAIGNAELQKHLKASQVSQRQLTYEIGSLEDSYQQCAILLNEAQQEVRTLRRKNGPSVMRQTLATFSPFPLEGSLAMELEDSMRRDAYPASSSPEERRKHNMSVMETARCVRRTASARHSRASSVAASSMLGGSCESLAESSRSSPYWSDGESFASDGYTGDVDSVLGSAHAKSTKASTDDLEMTLRRLSLRKANEINEQIINGNEADDKNRASFERCGDGTETPTPCQTPDGSSSASTDGSVSDLCQLSQNAHLSGYVFRMPEKLQIIKPMEGSVMLHKWQRLATPHLGLLESRPGVQVKGQQPPEDGGPVEVFSLCDVEEDEAYPVNVSNSLVQTASTYTFTTAKVLHPTSDFSPVSHSLSPLTSTPTTSICTPPTFDGGTSTFSLSLGLASRLGERGVRPDGKRRGAPVTARPVSRRFRSMVSDHIDTNAVKSRTEAKQSSAEQGLNAIGGLTSPNRETVKDIGLNTIMEIRRDHGTRPPFLLTKHAVMASPAVRRTMKRLTRPKTLFTSVRSPLGKPSPKSVSFANILPRLAKSKTVTSSNGVASSNYSVTLNNALSKNSTLSLYSLTSVNCATSHVRSSHHMKPSNSLTITQSAGLVTSNQSPRCSVRAHNSEHSTAPPVRIPEVVITPSTTGQTSSPLSIDSNPSAILRHIDALNITALGH